MCHLYKCHKRAVQTVKSLYSRCNWFTVFLIRVVFLIFWKLYSSEHPYTYFSFLCEFVMIMYLLKELVMECFCIYECSNARLSLMSWSLLFASSKIVTWSQSLSRAWNTTKQRCSHVLVHDVCFDYSQYSGFHFEGIKRKHMHDKINKAYAMLGIIKRNFNYLTISSFVLLYKSMVRSHLDYCSSVWVPYKKGDIELLEKVQKGQQS